MRIPWISKFWPKNPPKAAKKHQRLSPAELKKNQAQKQKGLENQQTNFHVYTQKVYKQKSETQLKTFLPKSLQKLTLEQSGLSANLSESTITRRKQAIFFGNSFLQQIKIFYLRSSKVFSKIRRVVFRYSILSLFNKLVGFTLILGILGFILYLGLFDRYFLIKNYTFTFTENSYLDQKEVDKIMQSFRTNKILGLAPSNQYWFLSSQNLTFLAKKSIPEVTNVEIIQQTWPNQAKLKLTTEPILLTLGVMENGQKKYYRITQAGKVLTEDTLGLREKLITVQENISFDKPNVSLQNYHLEKNDVQLNRFWFILWLWSELNKIGVKIVSTSIASIVNADTDVILVTNNQTKLLFDSTSLSKENQLKRLQAIFQSTIKDEETQAQLSYIDFRLPKKVFVCKKDKECKTPSV